VQGLCHISELSSSWLAKAEDVRKYIANFVCFDSFCMLSYPIVCSSFRPTKLAIVLMSSLLRFVVLFKVLTQLHECQVKP
jgi:hypothetical protein